MAFYPMNVDISGWRCLVVGGGQVAYRKVKTLVEYGAKVDVLAPELTSPVQELVDKGSVDYIAHEFREDILDGYAMVMVATGDSFTNRQVAEAAQNRNLLVNVADAPEHCSFMVPAVCRRGDLTVSISTGGKSPALARTLREKLEEELGPELEKLNAFLGEVRAYLLENFSDAEFRREVLQCLGDYRVAAFYRRGEGTELEKAVWSFLRRKDANNASGSCQVNEDS